jgi:hypothetical protein
MITFLIAIALQFATPTKSTVTSSGSTQTVCDNGGWVDKDIKR